MRQKYLFLLLFLAYAIFSVTPVFAVADVKIPEPLKPWVDWVLQDHQEELLCTPNFNNAEALKCNWPTALDLDIKAGQGSFRQNWLLEHEGWIQLPVTQKTGRKMSPSMASRLSYSTSRACPR